MKQKLGVLTFILIFFSMMAIINTWYEYDNQTEKSMECQKWVLSQELSNLSDDCLVYSSLYFDRFINGVIFSIVFISLTILSWKSDCLRKKY